MDERADEATREDVNVLIFDYLLCMAIHAEINATSGDTNPTWVGDTIWGKYSCVSTIRVLQMAEALRYIALRSGLPLTNELPAALQIKAQIFETIKALKDTGRSGSATLTETAAKLLLSCRSANLEEIEPYATTVAIHVCAHAASKAHQNSIEHSGKDAPGDSTSQPEPAISRNPTDSVARAMLTMGIPAEAMRHTNHQPAPINETLEVLSSIMQLLDPPVLLQLERGRLEGLSRAETQQLKHKIGMV
ncbi:hypothetical protein BDV06DRAFT_40767 [Aspergillus oleicola]